VVSRRGVAAPQPTVPQDDGEGMAHIAARSAQDDGEGMARFAPYSAQDDGEGADSNLIVVGDVDRLRQVLSNLIGNVARHTPKGSPVEIVLRREQDLAVLEIVDHGPGVSGADYAKIFERFYRADESRARSSGGNGLGLAIVAAIVAAHGGTAQAQPTPGGGLTIQVAIPLFSIPY